VYLASVTSDFFEALGTGVLEGHGIDAADEQRDGPVIVLSESAARLLSPERSLVGRELPWPLPAGAGEDASGGRGLTEWRPRCPGFPATHATVDCPQRGTYERSSVANRRSENPRKSAAARSHPPATIADRRSGCRKPSSRWVALVARRFWPGCTERRRELAIRSSRSPEKSSASSFEKLAGSGRVSPVQLSGEAVAALRRVPSILAPWRCP
jgi:hypothetical protein